MTKRQRTIFFFLFGLLFLMAAPGVILYSQGYRFDWNAGKIVQVGAFSFDIIPNQAEIFLNGKRVGQTGKFIGGAFTKNAPPGVYQIRIAKKGYHAWEKTLPVKAKQITEAKHIVLFPRQPLFTAFLENVQRAWLAPRGQEALVQKSRDGSWQLTLWNAATDAEYPLFEAQSSREAIAYIVWAPDASSFLLEITAHGQTELFLQEINRAALSSGQTRQEILLGAAASRVALALRPEPVGRPGFLNGNIAWLDSEGAFWQLRSPEDVAEQLPLSPFPPVSEFALSPDRKKLALASGRELWLFALQEWQEQPAAQEGERRFLTRFSQNVSNLTWLNSSYIGFVVQDTVKIAEIDNRDRLNVIDLAEFPHPDIFWDQADRRLYIHTDLRLLRSNRFIP